MGRSGKIQKDEKEFCPGLFKGGWLFGGITIFNSEDNKADRPANSRERWAGALMEVRSLFGLNSASCDGDRRSANGQTKRVIESLVRD